MIRDILAVLGGTIGMILKFILIIAMSLGGAYCFGTMFMCPFIWEGLMRLGITAAHAPKLGIVALPFQREFGPAYGIVHQKSDGVYVRRGGELTVPVLFRRDKLQLLSLPGRFAHRTEKDFPLLTQADIFRIDTASAASGSDLSHYGAAQIRDKRAKLLLIHLRELFSQSLFRFK